MKKSQKMKVVPIGLPGVEMFPHLGRVFLCYLEAPNSHIIKHPKSLTNKQIINRSEGWLPERDMSSLCVMGGGLEMSGNSSAAVAAAVPLKV